MKIFGNLEIRDLPERVVVLRMHNKVEGHEGCWLTHAEIETVISHLRGLVERGQRRQEIGAEIAKLEEEFEELL